jgi:hypothetical protein
MLVSVLFFKIELTFGTLASVLKLNSLHNHGLVLNPCWGCDCRCHNTHFYSQEMVYTNSFRRPGEQ